MISIVPARDELQKKLENQYPGQTVLGCEVFLEKRCLGFAAGTLKDTTVELRELRCEEPVLADGLARALLQLARSRGARDALCRKPFLYPLLDAMGFSAVTREGKRTAAIDEALRGVCSRGKS